MSTPDAFALADRAIHVWSFGLDLPPADAARTEAWLSPDERTRKAAFHFAADRAHFAAAHGRMRELLAGYLGGDPSAIRFATGSHGKPHLAGSSGTGDLRFSLSHSHGRALLAVTRGVEIGVDLERIRPEVDAAGIVASQFSPAERVAWQALPEARRQTAFFHAWVCKEAYVKALGEGLSREPARYTVELDPDAAGRLLADEIAPAAAATWRIERLLAPTGYTAAIAYPGPGRSIELRPA